jgi:hypothetical protein
MDVQRRKSLESSLPEGQVVDRAWLKQRGFGRPRVDFYLRSGALQAVAHGAYRRPGPPLKWEHVLYSLQELGYPVHVGGRSALEAQGLAHYLPLGGRTIALFGAGRWPGWVEQLAAEYRFERHNPKLFAQMPDGALTSRPFGHWDWPIRYACLELAFLELFAEIRTPTDYEVADKLFESAATLRPERVRSLLLACTHIKAKRLFLWFSARHQHPWSTVLDTEGVGLGRGKRMIIKGGVLDRCYQITVPRKMVGDVADGAGPGFF